MENVQHEQPINILLVEDNDADVTMTLRAFKKARLKNNIYVAGDGEEALDFVFNRAKYQNAAQFPRPDLILLDINLPKLNGLQVLEALKADQNFRRIPVIMLTSSSHEEDIVKSYSNGAASYISKPVEFEEFVEVVDGFNCYWHLICKIPCGKHTI